MSSIQEGKLVSTRGEVYYFTSTVCMYSGSCVWGAFAQSENFVANSAINLLLSFSSGILRFKERNWLLFSVFWACS